jgi:ATP-dependent 26S proteasome regulatory subunit
MGKDRVLVKVNSEGKYVVEVEKEVDMTQLKPQVRVALRNDSYALHKILPNKASLYPVADSRISLGVFFCFVFAG